MYTANIEDIFINIPIQKNRKDENTVEKLEYERMKKIWKNLKKMEENGRRWKNMNEKRTRWKIKERRKWKKMVDERRKRG